MNEFTIIIKSYEDRTFTGYVSVEVIDQDGDIVPVKVLNESFGPYMKGGGPLLLVHQALPIGVIEKHMITKHPETGKPAVAFHGRIHNDGRSLCDATWDQFVSGAKIGFSIGAKPIEYRVVKLEGKPVRIFEKIELYEVSVVCDFNGHKHEPANQFASLIGLGHLEVANQIPIAAKMVVKMADPKPKEEEDIEAKKKESEEASDEPTDDDIRKSIQEKVDRESERLAGGSAALSLIKKEQALNAELNKQLQTLKETNEQLILKTSQLEASVKDLSIKVKTEQITAEMWQEKYKASVSSEDSLKAGTLTKTKKAAAVEINNYLNSDVPISQEEFSKLCADARNNW